MIDRYAGSMPDAFFRVLSPDEEASFRQWARDNFKPGDDVNPVWHPVVRDEVRLMEQEAA